MPLKEYFGGPAGRVWAQATWLGTPAADAAAAVRCSRLLWLERGCDRGVWGGCSRGEGHWYAAAAAMASFIRALMPAFTSLPRVVHGRSSSSTPPQNGTTACGSSSLVEWLAS